MRINKLYEWILDPDENRSVRRFLPDYPRGFLVYKISMGELCPGNRLYLSFRCSTEPDADHIEFPQTTAWICEETKL